MTLFVRDNFLGDSELAGLVKESSDFFPPVMPGENIGGTLNEYHAEQADCYAPYMFWYGWWDSPAVSIRQKVIEKIWRDTGILPFPEDEVLGFEYWTRTFKEGQYLARHVDEDTFMYADTRWFHGPRIGCVWYGFSEADGGFLEIHETGVDEGFEKLEAQNTASIISPPDRRERIAYRPDRLVVFDAGHRLHETTPIISGTKHVMVVNVWHKDNIPYALSTGDFHFENH